MKTSLYSIGHGHKSIEEFIEELNSFEISYLIDVRTVPYSKWNPEFNQETLKRDLNKYCQIRYDWWGNPESDSYIGGRPLSTECLDDDGFFDYKEMAKDYRFKRGLERLVLASENGLRVALMCSESNPSECHRSKLIGRELYFQYKINMRHIIDVSKTISEVDVIRGLCRGWEPNSLFSDQPEPYFKSRKSYKSTIQLSYQYDTEFYTIGSY